MSKLNPFHVAVPVKNVDEVLKIALTKPLKAVKWVDVEQLPEKNRTKPGVSSRH